jgi:hypothetical protein
MGDGVAHPMHELIGKPEMPKEKREENQNWSRYLPGVQAFSVEGRAAPTVGADRNSAPSFPGGTRKW